MTEAPAVQTQTSSAALAARAFAASDYDFNSLFGGPGLLLERPDRRGVSIVMARTTELPDDAVDALLAWRLGQYLLTGFYDPTVVERLGMLLEPRADVHDGDIHGLAIDRGGGLCAYLTLKQPDLSDAERALTYAAAERPAFPCEEVHGRGWQKSLKNTENIELDACWELARFVKDQRRPDDPVCLRAPLELGLVAARLGRHPRFQKHVRLITGDLDPEVALRNLRYFFVPVATCSPHHVALSGGHPLRPRYQDHPTAPFVAAPTDVDNTTYIRWADIDLALDRPDDEALVRLLALRQFVRVKESSLKQPLSPPGDSDYPEEALTAASSQAVSTALWDAAKSGRIPWRAIRLGPGECIPKDEAFWIVDGFVQALAISPGGSSAHLAGLGPEVAYLPHEGSMEGLAELEATTPVRAIATSAEHFEEFWRARQSIFETTTQSLYD
ncbi:MAG TPA: hypothetical protein VFF07_02610 [Actinomycetota bacterium]|nr:hypothetical protein [Actinomycetota bacterium]